MAKAGGLKIGNFNPSLRNILDRVVPFRGVPAMNVLRLAANVADTETVTIGPDTYEVETVATATGQTTGTSGFFNNTNNPLLVPFTLAQLGAAVGDPLACENEIVQIIRDAGSQGVVVARGRYGTTAAAHGNSIAINRGNGITAGRIPVGFIATFTPAVAGPAFAAAINNALVASETSRCAAKCSTIYPRITAVSLNSGAELLIYANDPTQFALTLACTETLAGANNAWQAAAMAGGVAPGVKAITTATRVPTAQEVTIGNLRVPFPNTVRAAIVEIYVTATGVKKAWDGGTNISGNVVTLDNVGGTDWAATDTIVVIGIE